MAKPKTEAGTARPVDRTKNGGKLSPLRRLKDRCAKLAAINAELLAACKLILAAYESMPDDVPVPDEINKPSEAWDAVEAAIAKAEGQ